jgi:putative ABC transport system permease protein
MNLNLHVHPILAALLRNRTGAVLVALQIALALAILVNATFIVEQRVESINRPSGIDEKNLFAIDAAGFTARYDYTSSVRDDLTYLRSLDGVIAATVTDNVPMSGSSNSNALLRRPERNFSNAVFAYMYEMDEQGLLTLGAHIVAGRGFRKEEILPPLDPSTEMRPFPHVVVTQRLARTFFPDGNALGKTVYDTVGRPVTIIGIASDMVGSWPTGDYMLHGIYWVPQQPLMYGFHYLVRTKPGRRDEVMRIASEHLAQSSPDRVIKSVTSVETYKKATFLSNRVTAVALATVNVLLLGVAALGIFGLATFNVTTRTKQIGTRRAVGARKRDIIRYFMVENGLVTTSGVVLGCALALGVGYWLSLLYQLPRLDLYYLVGGILVLWLVGQLATWQPARRASAVPPSVATRTV